jgi:hypothetical protein
VIGLNGFDEAHNPFTDEKAHRAEVLSSIAVQIAGELGPDRVVEFGRAYSTFETLLIKAFSQAPDDLITYCSDTFNRIHGEGV